jgi:hypothetical protein
MVWKSHCVEGAVGRLDHDITVANLDGKDRMVLFGGMDLKGIFNDLVSFNIS